MLKKAIVGSIIRRVAGYLGVAGLMGFEHDVMKLLGAIVAAVSMAYSLYRKVKAYREGKAV